MEWVGPDGSVVVSEENRTKVESGENRTVVELRENRPRSYTLSLSFNPALTSHGGMYTCRANLSVPWMDVQPEQLQTSYYLTVKCE